MAKYVQCIDNADVTHCLSVGRVYKVVNEDSVNWQIESDDNKYTNYFAKSRFVTDYETSEAIVFTSKKEFDNAVMAVVLERLKVYNHGSGIPFYIKDKQ